MSTLRKINSDLGFIPMKTLQQLKLNTELVIGDYVAVAETCLFYKIQQESTSVKLNNGLYANEVKHSNLTTTAKDLIGAINELKISIDDLKENKLDKNNGAATGTLTVNDIYIKG